VCPTVALAAERGREPSRYDGAVAEPTTIETVRQPTTTTYHRVDVTEDYRWLEDASSEETKTWTNEPTGNLDFVTGGEIRSLLLGLKGRARHDGRRGDV
jgi:hypothetical protein